MRARHYLEIIDDVIVSKQAVGPDRQPDNSEIYPSVPVNWQLVSFEQYMEAQPGYLLKPDGTIEKPIKPRRPVKLEERLAKLEAKLARIEAKLLRADTKISQLEEDSPFMRNTSPNDPPK